MPRRFPALEGGLWLALVLLPVVAAADCPDTFQSVGVSLVPLGDRCFVFAAEPAGDGTLLIGHVRNLIPMADSGFHAQKMDAAGQLLWGPTGVPLRPATGIVTLDPHPAPMLDAGPASYAPGSGTLIRVVPDGNGGGIFLYMRTQGYAVVDLVAEHLGADGQYLWEEPRPVRSPILGNHQVYDFMACSDGHGGAFAAWIEGPLPSAQDLPWRMRTRAQHLGPSGERLWGPDGVDAVDRIEMQFGMSAVPDGHDGLIVGWLGNDADPVSFDVRPVVQRISWDGRRLWGDHGVWVDPRISMQDPPQFAADGEGGVFCSWMTNSFPRPHVQHIDKSGAAVWTVPWTPPGSGSLVPVIASDAHGGCISAWSVNGLGYAPAPVMAIALTPDGAARWGPSMVAELELSNVLAIERSGNSALTIVMNADFPTPGGLQIERISDDGEVLLPDSSISLATEARGSLGLRHFVDLGEQGWWAAWITNVMTNTIVQHHTTTGAPAYIVPRITGVRDVPGDQGHWLSVEWDGPANDCNPIQQAITYELQRAEQWPPHDQWTTVATVPGSDAFHYSAIAPTIPGLPSRPDPLAHFRVVARSEASGTPRVWISPPDSGQEIDNIGPGTVTGLTATYDWDYHQAILHWDENPEPDILGYQIYRAAAYEFDASPATAWTTTSSTFISYTGSPPMSFRVAALDRHLNEGPSVHVIPQGIAEVPEATHREFALGVPHPNPARDHVTLEISVQDAGTARLEVVDISGRVVRVEALGAMSAGSRLFTLPLQQASGRRLVPGVYHVRVLSTAGTRVRRLVIVD